MKSHSVVGSLIAFMSSAIASESMLTTTFQPLDGLGSGQIFIVPVACHHWHSSSASSAVDLIAAANVPPTDNPDQAKENLNLASVCGVKFSTSDLGSPLAPLELTMDATNFGIPKRFSHKREDIVRACLECLRRCLPDKLSKTPVSLKCSDANRGWLTEIVMEFNAHDRMMVFFAPP